MDFQLSATTLVEASAADVFDIITDLNGLQTWNAEIPAVVEPCDALRVGAQWVVEIHAMHTRWNSRSTIVELDRPQRRFAYRSQSDDGNASFANWRWEVLETPAGSRVSVSMDAHPQTFWRRNLFSKIRPSSLEKAMNESLRALRTRATARGVTAPSNERRSA